MFLKMGPVAIDEEKSLIKAQVLLNQFNRCPARLTLKQIRPPLEEVLADYRIFSDIRTDCI